MSFPTRQDKQLQNHQELSLSTLVTVHLLKIRKELYQLRIFKIYDDVHKNLFKSNDSLKGKNIMTFTLLLVNTI